MKKKFNYFSVLFMIVVLVISLICQSAPVQTYAADKNESGITVELKNRSSFEKTVMLGGELIIKNNTDKEIDLSKLLFKYYYNADGNEKQNFTCDYSGTINTRKYINFTNNIKGEIVSENNSDNSKKDVIKISFKEGKLEAKGQASVHYRVSKNNWGWYNQKNDYSFKNGVETEGLDIITNESGNEEDNKDNQDKDNPGKDKDDEDNNQNNKKVLRVNGTKLYDAAGNEVILRGVNVPLGGFADWAATSEANAKCRYNVNATRAWISTGTRWGKTDLSVIENYVNISRKYNILCVLEVHDYQGSNKTEDLEKIVDYWKQFKKLLNDNEDMVILNIANEWLGDEKQASKWAPAYKKAVKELRDSGINNVLMIDAPGWGQVVDPMAESCRDVLNADPLKQIMFSIHMYQKAGKDKEVIKSNIDKMLNQGVCTVIGEFGAGKEFGGPNVVDSAYVMDYCQQKGVGTFAWCWKGNTLKGTEYLDLVKDWAGEELTPWGEFVINSKNGIKNTSKPVTLARPYQQN